MAITDSLQLYWKLDETEGTTANDELSNYDGDITVGTGGINQAGKIGRAVLLTDGDIDLGLNTFASATFSDNGFSLTMWVKASGSTILFDFEGAWVSTIDGDGYVDFKIDGLAPNNKSTSTIADGEWHFVVLTADSSGNCNIYIDGNTSEKSFTESWYNIGLLSRNQRIGSGWGGTTGNSTMDEVGLWNKELTTAEIATIYNSGGGLTYPFGGTDHTETPSDGFSMSDALVSVGGQTIVLSETLNILDNLITSGNMTLSISDTQNLSDSLSSSTNFNKLLSDIQSITDSLSSQSGFSVLLTDLQNITDDLTSKVEFNVNLDDTINMTDDLTDTLTTLVRVLSKIYKLGLIKYDNILTSDDEVIKLKSVGRVFSIPLISHWNLNDNLENTNVIDGAGLNDLTIIGGRNSDDLSSVGKINNCFKFNGSSDRLKKTSITELAFAPNSFSTSFWINPSTIGVGYRAILEYNRSGLNWFGIWQNGSKIHFRVGSTTLNSLGSIPLDEWTHVTCTYNSSNNLMTIYLNSVSDETKVRTAGFTSPVVSNLLVGVRGDEASEFLNGCLDDIRIYGFLLNQEQINLIYNSGSGTELSNITYGGSNIILNLKDKSITLKTDKGGTIKI